MSPRELLLEAAREELEEAYAPEPVPVGEPPPGFQLPGKMLAGARSIGRLQPEGYVHLGWFEWDRTEVRLRVEDGPTVRVDWPWVLRELWAAENAMSLFD